MCLGTSLMASVHATHINGSADAAYWQGRTCLEAGDWPGAVAALTKGIKRAPKQAPFYRARGLALARLDRFSEAIRDCRAAIKLLPSMALAHSDLGVCLLKTNRAKEAIPPLEMALRLEPSLAQARSCLGIAYAHAGMPDRALQILDTAVKDDPDPQIQSARAWAMLGQGRVDDAVATLERALARHPADLISHYNLVFSLQHRQGITTRDLYLAHRNFAESCFPGSPAVLPKRLLPMGEKPILGVVSGDLRHHAASHLTLRAFEGLGKRGFQLVAFANQSESDQLTVRWRKLCRGFHTVGEMKDDDLHALIRREKIDILFDLSGFTARHRLPVFARRAAPVQITWAGYTGTTGLPTMDALIADAREVPESEDADYVERIIRLPDAYVCYLPPSRAPEPIKRSLEAGGAPVFGCFQRPAKLNAEIFSLWARIAQRVPGTRFILRYSSYAETETRTRISALAREAGLDPGFLVFQPGGSMESMLAGYAQIDVGLDTRPYSGGVTTLESLWMGVPVITWPGNTFAGRHSASHLHAMGLQELIAASADEYVNLAVELAADRRRVSTYRTELRGRMLASTLCDADRFSGHLARELMLLWESK
jgi:predicted O-linked N-acetylglucosamine transferase (SPINDLY family)